MIKEWLNNILRTSFHNAQSSIRSVVYNVFEPAMLNLLGQDVIDETLDAQIAKFFDTDAATEGLSKRLLTWSSFMEPIGTLDRRKTNKVMEEKKYNVAYAVKEPMDTVPAVSDSKSPPKLSDSGND